MGVTCCSCPIPHPRNTVLANLGREGGNTQMESTTNPQRPAWFVLTILAAVILALVLVLNATLGQNDGLKVNTHNLVTELCSNDPDC